MDYKIIYMVAVCIGVVGLIIPFGDTLIQTLPKLISILMAMTIADIGLFNHKKNIPANNPKNIKRKTFLDTMSFVLMIMVITFTSIMFILTMEGNY